MNLIDLEAEKGYVLDGKYTVNTLEGMYNVDKETVERMKKILALVSDIADIESAKGRLSSEKSDFSEGI